MKDSTQGSYDTIPMFFLLKIDVHKNLPLLPMKSKVPGVLDLYIFRP